MVTVGFKGRLPEYVVYVFGVGRIGLTFCARVLYKTKQTQMKRKNFITMKITKFFELTSEQIVEDKI